MTEQELIDLRGEIAELLSKHKPLTAEDLQKLRGAGAVASQFSSHSDPLRLRLDVELIDAVRLLNASSTRLMIAAIAVSVLGICLAAAQVGIALANKHAAPAVSTLTRH